MSELINAEEGKNLLLELRGLIEQSKKQISRYVNTGMVSLYWQIGKRLKEEVLNNQRATYGQEVVASVAYNLSQEYGKGFTRVSLIRMIQFYEAFPDPQISSTVSNQLTWSHMIEVLSLKDKTQQDFYVFMAIEENWSVRELRHNVKRMVYERTLSNQRPKQPSEILHAGSFHSDMVLKDPYVLDFLDLPAEHCESELEEGHRQLNSKKVSYA